MFSVLRILLALSLLFVLCSSQKSFLKGLLLGSILGHKKGSMMHEGKGETKEYHHFDKEPVYHAPIVEKEYVPVPVHEEPRFIPIYIVKECDKKSYSPSVVHHHDHHHNYDYAGNKISDFGSGYDSGHNSGHDSGYDSAEDFEYKSASKYKGTLDGYSESRQNNVRNEPNYTKSEDNSVGIVLSLHKELVNKKY